MTDEHPANSSTKMKQQQVQELANQTRVILEQATANLKQLQAEGFSTHGNYVAAECRFKIEIHRTFKESYSI